MAVLAGDGLLNLAYETAASAFDRADDADTAKRVAQALKVLGHKAGIYGMIGGQAADVEAENKERISNEELLFIHENKTAALIQAAMMIGAILAGAGKEAVDAMEQAAYLIGIAFQIQDDILDVTSSTEVLGKPVGSDARNHKLTYVTLHGLKDSEKEVKRMSGEAITILQSFDNRNEFLEELVTFLITRKK